MTAPGADGAGRLDGADVRRVIVEQVIVAADPATTFRVARSLDSAADENGGTWSPANAA
jgi:hypothetical protein